MSYYYQGTSLSTICNYITSAQDNVQNLKIAKKTDYTSLGITETPTKTGFYNATHTDYSTFCIAYYTENQLVSIPSWCRQLRIVMIGGGGSGTTYQGGDHQHVAAVNTHTMTHDHVATVHTHTAQHQQQAAVQTTGTQTHQHVAAVQQAGTQVHGGHGNQNDYSDAGIHDHQQGVHYDKPITRRQYDGIINPYASMTTTHFHDWYRDTVHQHAVAVDQNGAQVHQAGSQVDQTGTQVHQAAAQQDQQQNQQDQQGHQTDTQNTQQDVPVQHKDTPTAGAGGGGGAFVYISTFQVSNVTSPSMSANSNNVYLTFTTGGTNYSIVANGGGNSSGTSAGSGGTVTVSNIQQQGDATQQTLQGQTWLQGRSSAGQNGQGQNGGSSSGGAGGDCNIINNTFMKQYGFGGSTSSTGGGSTYYRVYYLTN